MTCVVGLIHHGVVTMGADSAISYGYERTITQGHKVFHSGDMLIGYSGSLRLGQLVQYALELPEDSVGVDGEEYIVMSFVPALRACFHRYESDEKDLQSELDESYYLVAREGRLFTIANANTVTEAAAGYNAIGKAANVARGVLYACQHMRDGSTLTAREQVQLALEAAEQWSTAVCRPFVIETLSAEE